MEQKNSGTGCAFYTVKQLAALFGKSEDTIRRWKNEGVGREEGNTKLRAVEKGESEGRRNARHLVFSREAVIDFVRANPFLMDGAPQLSLMMEAEGVLQDGGARLKGAAEPQKKREMLLYVSHVLGGRRSELEDELAELQEAMRELNSGAMEERYAATIRRTMLSRREELRKKIGYLSDFISLMEAE